MKKVELMVYEDGEMVGVCEVDLDDKKDIVRVLVENFNCEEDVEFDVDLSEGEIYVGISECEYLWSKV